MTDLQALLDQIDRLDQEAEAGPWDHEREVNTQNGWSLGTVRSGRTGESVAPEVYDPDGEFIALARIALPKLAKALCAVMELHARHTAFDGNLDFCPICVKSEGATYPCDTVRAITDALEGDDD